MAVIHGTYPAYSGSGAARCRAGPGGGRCKSCTQANADYKRALAARKPRAMGRQVWAAPQLAIRMAQARAQCFACTPNHPCYYHDKLDRGLIA